MASPQQRVHAKDVARINAELQKSVKRNKYGNTWVEHDGIKFQSKAEAKRYQELKLLERAGEICNLTLQPRFPIILEGILICTVVADFQYIMVKPNPGMIATEDVKGMDTPISKIKRKLFTAVYRREMRIIK